MKDKTAAVRSPGAPVQDVRPRSCCAAIGVGTAAMTPRAIVIERALPLDAVSFPLKERLHAGPLTQVRDGRHLIRRPSVGAMNTLLACLLAHCCRTFTCHSTPVRSERTCTTS